MTSLFLDTSSSYLTVGVLTDNKLIKDRYIYLGKDMASYVLSNIDEVLKEANLSQDDIEKIICVNGPGSFTGIRVGVTIAKTYAYAKELPVVALSSLFSMAASVNGYEYIIPIIDARRNYFFAGIYDKSLNSVMSDRYISYDELMDEVNKLDGSYTFVGVEEYLKFNNIIYKPDVENIVKNITLEEIDSHLLVPNYLKKTEAEEKLNK